MKKALPYSNLARSLRRWLRKQFPPMPKHIVDLQEVLSCDEWKKRLTYIVKGEIENEIIITNVLDEAEFCHIILHSENFLKAVLEFDVSTATVDGTFKTVPWLKGSYQMLIFSVFAFGKVFFWI